MGKKNPGKKKRATQIKQHIQIVIYQDKVEFIPGMKSQAKINQCNSVYQ